MPPESAIRRIVVADVQVPFVEGGADLHVRTLVDQLRDRGYEVEKATIPFRPQPKSELLAQAAAWRLLDLSGGILEFVRDGESGFVCSPDPESIGNAVARLAGARDLARWLGERGRARAAQVTWDGVVEQLVG